MKENIEELIKNQNAFIRKWGKEQANRTLPASVGAAGINSSSPSNPFKLKVRFYTQKKEGVGEINRIGFTMARHGVFVEKGVGSGRKIRSGKERPKPWFNKAVDNNLAELAEGIAAITGATIVSNLKIK